MKKKQCREDGFIIDALDLSHLFSPDEEPEYKQYVKEGNTEKVAEMISIWLPHAPSPSNTFILTKEDIDISANPWLEPGKMYIEFCECDLFNKTPTPELTWLTKNKVNPKLNTWTVLV